MYSLIHIKHIFLVQIFVLGSQGYDEKTFRVQCLLKKAEWMRDAACPLIDVLETVMEAR